MDDNLITALLEQGEGSTVDYKRAPYVLTREEAASNGKHADPAHFERKKSELLKDVLAMSNAFRERDSYILIGVQERQGEPAEAIGVEKAAIHDEASIQQFIATHIEKPLVFEYKTVAYRDKTIIVLRVPLEQPSKRPFLSKNDYGVVNKGAVYLRRGSHTDVAGSETLRSMFEEEGRGAPIVPPQVSLLDHIGAATQHLDTAFSQTRVSNLHTLPDFEDERSWVGRSLGGRVNSSYWRDFGARVQITLNSAWVYLEILNPSNINLTECTVQIDVTTTGGTSIPAHNRMPISPKRFGDQQAWLKEHEKFLRSQACPPGVRHGKELSSRDLRPGDKSSLSDGLLLHFGEHQTLHLHYRVLAKELRQPAEGLLVVTMGDGIDDLTFDRLKTLASRDRMEHGPRSVRP